MSKIHGVSTHRASSPDEPEPLHPPSQQSARAKPHASGQSERQPRSVAVDSLVAAHKATSGKPSAASRFVAIQRPPITSEPSILGGSYAETKTEQAVHNVAIVAARLGLPTKVLEAALKRDAFTDFSPLSSTSHIVLGNQIHLNDADSDAARDWNEHSLSASTAIGTVYHEAIHQHLLDALTEPVRRFVERGIRIYTSADVVSDHPEQVESTRNPESVFHEAVADYAGKRIGAWEHAREMLRAAAADGKLSAKQLEIIADGYDRAMADRTFGYQVAAWYEQAIGEHGRDTTMPIPEEIRVWVDTVLLEGRIPSRFKDDSTFQEYATLVANGAT